MLKRILKSTLIFAIVLTVFNLSDAKSKKYEYKLIKLEKIARYHEDRVAFQHIEAVHDEYVFSKQDNSVASLLIIKNKMVYLFKDGYDDPKMVMHKKKGIDIANRMLEDLWVNKIDGKPDSVRITERKVELLKNRKQEFVTKNFGEFYIKIRDKFIKKHVNILKSLIINRKYSDLKIVRKPIPKALSYKGPTKYYSSVTAKSGDQTVYFAEDSDGDNVTETFVARIPDGFDWGYKSGPNILFIYKNRSADLKAIIGKLTHEAYFGSPEEEQLLIKTFPKEEDVSEMIDHIYRKARTRK
ncbi:hypothetical protein ACFL20_09455 [Spirochaetota bacterium]